MRRKGVDEEDSEDWFKILSWDRKFEMIESTEVSRTIPPRMI